MERRIKEIIAIVLFLGIFIAYFLLIGAKFNIQNITSSSEQFPYIPSFKTNQTNQTIQIIETKDICKSSFLFGLDLMKIKKINFNISTNFNYAISDYKAKIIYHNFTLNRNNITICNNTLLISSNLIYFVNIKGG